MPIPGSSFFNVSKSLAAVLPALPAVAAALAAVALSSLGGFGGAPPGLGTIHGGSSGSSRVVLRTPWGHAASHLAWSTRIAAVIMLPVVVGGGVLAAPAWSSPPRRTCRKDPSGTNRWEL